MYAFVLLRRTLVICGASVPRGGCGPTSEAARLLPRKALEKILWPRLGGATATGMAAVKEDVTSSQWRVP